ncbi:MAG TPA: hypothetical protein VFZ85_13075 [Jiangellaceae bacterium]
MPTLFVPEEKWAPRSWSVNHPLYVQAHIEHWLEEAEYGYWGVLPADVPEGGYRASGQPWSVTSRSTPTGASATRSTSTAGSSRRGISLDQGMITAAIGNHLAGDMLREAFVTPQFEGRLRPVMAMEEFANFRPRS